MTIRTIRDVLGEPDRWPNLTPVSGGHPDLRDAEIVEVIVQGVDLMIASQDGSAGTMISTFVVSDATDREAIVRLLRPGMRVREAIALTI